MLQKFNFTLILVVCFALIACKSSNQTNIKKASNVDSNQIEVDYKYDDSNPNRKFPQTNFKELAERVIYPEEAKIANIEGKVVIRTLIDINGDVLKAVIEYSDAIELNDAAVTAIKQTKFTPAMENGKPVTVWVSIPINFKLDK